MFAARMPRARDIPDALADNCTITSIGGIASGDKGLAAVMVNSAESKGRGLSWFEKKLAGKAVGSSIFMPTDLQANIDSAKNYTEKHIKRMYTYRIAMFGIPISDIICIIPG